MEMKEIRNFLLKVCQKFEEKDLAHLTKLYEKGSNSVECKQLEKADDFFERNESEMGRWIVLNGRGEIDQIVRIKQMMNRYLMEFKYVAMLELHNPLIMAFDIMGDKIEFLTNDNLPSMALLKEIFEIADDKDELISDQFWFFITNNLLENKENADEGKKDYETFLLMSSIQLALGDKVLDALELAHPELMHFESLTFSHNYLLFLRQLSHKTGSLSAIAEQRRRTRKKTLEFLWKSLAKTGLKMMDPIRAIQGGMTRLWKTLYDSEKTAEQNDYDISALRELMGGSKVMPDYDDHFQMLTEFYDQIFDQSEAEVEQNEHYLVDLIFETKNDVERIMAGQSAKVGTETESAEEWRKRNFYKIIHGTRGQSLEKAKHWENYLPWMTELHGLTLAKLIKTNEHFAQKLRTAYESSLATRGFLIEILE
uniref:Nuclear pore complex protein n=1 Tax=Globodera pallida TaxID=36090 RepID=A0A183BPA0_GLOPA